MRRWKKAKPGAFKMPEEKNEREQFREGLARRRFGRVRCGAGGRCTARRRLRRK